MTRKCDLCGTETDVEFKITSKHTNWVLCNELKRLNASGTSHVVKHICKKCFIKMFGVPKRK